MRIAPMCIAASLLVGCASASHQAEARLGYAADGTVSADIVDVASDTRYQAVQGSSYLQPIGRRANLRPAYPAALLDRRLPPVEVVARIVVDGKGEVERASVIESGMDAAFDEAVLHAVRGWTFVPLMRVTGDKAEPLPFTQDYRFTFRQVNGHAVVESTSAR